ncbi:hypothetical protein BVRB_5g098880 [Beta vulgaris subsp. vulgaris]|nr:hypothetical protein BVRB_5g098880 [Beta vulgaris subsp. vulgaris]
MSLYLADDKPSYRTSDTGASTSLPLNIYEMSATSSSSPPPPPPSSSSKEEESTLNGKQQALVSTEEETMSKSSKKTTNTNTAIPHGVVSLIGRRRSMEDAVAILPGLVRVVKHDSSKVAELLDYDFFAVYDGHGGGHKVAQKCKERLHEYVVEEMNDVGIMNEWESVMVSSFAKMNDEVEKIVVEDFDVSYGVAEVAMGSTALVVLVGKEEIVVANCGKSRVVLFHDGAALPLSRDYQHKRPKENEGVEAAEGDKSLQPSMIHEPDVIVHKRIPSDEFLVIASDGLWDVLSNETACDIVTKCFSDEVVCKMVVDGLTANCASASAAMLVELALARGSNDNITVIVVKLQSRDC